MKTNQVDYETKYTGLVISIGELKRAIEYIESTRTKVDDSTTGVFDYDNFLRIRGETQ